MPKYTVVITQSVQKYLKKIPDKLADRLESEMMNLEINPRQAIEKRFTKENNL